MVKTKKTNKRDVSIDEDEDDDDDNEAVIITSKLQLVLAAKSRRLQYTSSPIINHHVSVSLLSSPSRAAVPFSWEEEPGKPKHHLRHPSYSKCLDLPPRLLLPPGFTKNPLTANHRRRLAGMKRWFRWRKERACDGYVFPSGNEDGDVETTRTGGCLSYFTRCYSHGTFHVEEQQAENKCF